MNAIEQRNPANNPFENEPFLEYGVNGHVVSKPNRTDSEWAQSPFSQPNAIESVSYAESVCTAHRDTHYRWRHSVGKLSLAHTHKQNRTKPNSSFFLFRSFLFCLLMCTVPHAACTARFVWKRSMCAVLSSFFFYQRFALLNCNFCQMQLYALVFVHRNVCGKVIRSNAFHSNHGISICVFVAALLVLL